MALENLTHKPSGIRSEPLQRGLIETMNPLEYAKSSHHSEPGSEKPEIATIIRVILELISKFHISKQNDR